MPRKAVRTTDREHAIEEIRQLITPVLRKHDVRKAAVFGSVAKGSAEIDSDVDLLVEFEDGKKKTLLDLVQLETDVAAELRCRVDIVTYGGLHPVLRKRVLREQVIILGH
ncbi:MAG: nucleotidyltransferase family protein [Actinobacteria bacterium]|nr:nucleotidyltransferase family protein [Actinomycetota bacterium]